MTSTAWTRRLQILTAVGSFVFTIGTALQTFVVDDLDLLEQTMQLAGMTAVEAVESAPGSTPDSAWSAACSWWATR